MSRLRFSPRRCSALRSLALRVGFTLSLSVSMCGLLVTGCTPPSNKPAAAKTPSKKPTASPKKRPTDPWLEEVVSKAEVTVTPTDGKAVSCTWNASKKRHLCPGQQSWVYVGPQVLKVDGKQALCVWQHPTDGGTVTTKMKGVASAPLELRHAFSGGAAGVKEAAPVDIVIRVDGEERSKTQRLRKAGFDKVRIEPASAGKPGDLELQVSASHTGVAHFCWQLARLDGAKAMPTAAAPAAGATAEIKTATAKPLDGAKAEPAATDDKAAAKDAKASAASTSGKPKPALRSVLPKGRELKVKVPLKPLRAAPQPEENP